MQTLDATRFRAILDDACADVTDCHEARALLRLDEARRMLLTSLSAKHAPNAREKR